MVQKLSFLANSVVIGSGDSAVTLGANSGSLVITDVNSNVVTLVPGQGSTLARLTDVAQATPTDGQILKYSSANTTYYFADESGGGTTVYATANSLPLSGVSGGTLAYVTSTERLYVWLGTGWYNIGTVNTSPNITSGPNATYDLSPDGTATVITLVANDPEGIPITWSYSITSGSLGNTATITQSNNVFTITPSTDPLDNGTFEITFTASDGINLSTAASSITLTITANYEASSVVYDTYISDPQSPGVDLIVAPDGNSIISLYYSSSTLFKYPLGTAWDLSSFGGVGNFTGQSLKIGTAASLSAWRTITMNHTGTKLFALRSTTLHEYTLSTAFDITTMSHVTSASVLANASYQMRMSDDSKILTGMGTGLNNFVYFYVFSNPSNPTISTMSYLGSVRLNTIATGEGTMLISSAIVLNGGTRLLATSTYGASKKLLTFKMSTPYDITTLSYEGSKNTTGDDATAPQYADDWTALSAKPDGSRVYNFVAGSGFFQWDMG